MPESNYPSRRQFLTVAGAGMLTAGLSGRIPESAAAELPQGSGTSPAGVNPFTDPSYAAGAKARMQEFVGRGADPKETAAIFGSLTSLDAEPWVAAWTRLAVPYEHQAAELESQGKIAEANKAYQKAFTYYSIAKFPVINHPAKQAAYRKSIECFLKAARSEDPPVERVAIPFENKQIIGYLRKPKAVTRPPVVIATGGVDVYKEDRNTNDLLAVGLAAFSMDMPGAGECPVWNTPDAESSTPPPSIIC